MKKLFLIGAVITGFMTLHPSTSSGQAQATDNRKPIDPKERATQQTERMTKLLGLNEDSKKKVYDLNFETAQKMSELKTKYANDKKVMQRERMKLRSDQNCRMKDVLSSEQYDKWLDHKVEQKHKHRHKHMRNNGGPQQKMKPVNEPIKLGE